MMDGPVNDLARGVVVIGAGMGGLAAAIDLAAAGVAVTVLDRLPAPGGKMRAAVPPGADPTLPIDAGPTVLTMLDVFERLFGDAGADFAARVPTRPASRLARHHWPDGRGLDLYADAARSRDAIGTFAGAAEARRFDRFRTRAEAIRRTLDASFMRASRPDLVTLVRRAGARNLACVSPWGTMATLLRRQFRDRRLRQLYGRYATYCGSSPFEAPATLALVAAVEANGVWLVDGGMRRLAAAMAALAAEKGCRLRFGAEVARVVVAGGRARGVVLRSGEHVPAGAVICNADPDALATGLLGDQTRVAVRPRRVADRSLSAVTWALHLADPAPALIRHNVFFSDDDAAEFRDLRHGLRVPASPTVYVCAADREDGSPGAPIPAGGAGRALILVNAPPVGDRPDRFGLEELDQCTDRVTRRLREAGLSAAPVPGTAALRTGPREWEALFPGTGGGLYGTALRGWRAPFRRPDARATIPGLYLAGGGVHPGPGVPMATLSGRLAAAAVLSDRRSTPRSVPAGMPGGMSTRCPTTAPTG